VFCKAESWRSERRIGGIGVHRIGSWKGGTLFAQDFVQPNLVVRPDSFTQIVEHLDHSEGLFRSPVVGKDEGEAPHHPLSSTAEPVPDEVIRQYRAVTVADSVQRGAGMSIGLLAGQDVFTVASMPAKLDAQTRAMGVGFLPTCLAQPYIDTGRLVVKRVQRPEYQVQVSYAWGKGAADSQGRALRWWLGQLQKPVTRAALLGEH